MSMQPPHLRPCPECGGQRILNPDAVELWISGVHTSDYDLNAVMCFVCGNTSFYPAHPEIVIPKVQQAAADRQAAEQKRLQKEWEKQQKRQGR